MSLVVDSLGWRSNFSAEIVFVNWAGGCDTLCEVTNKSWHNDHLSPVCNLRGRALIAKGTLDFDSKGKLRRN